MIEKHSIAYVFLAGLFLALAIALSAAAQNPELPWRLRDEPRVTRVELEAFFEDQQLDASDAAIILRSAHDDLMAEYAELARLRANEQERMQQLQREWYAANPPQPGVPRMPPSFSDPRYQNEMRQRRTRIEEDFQATVAALLGESTVREWQRLVHMKERQHVLYELQEFTTTNEARPYADLVLVCGDANLADEDGDAIQPILDQYESEMASAISAYLAREGDIIQALSESRAAPAEADTPEEKRQREERSRLATELRSLRDAMIAVNDRHQTLVESALTPAGLRKFRRAIKQQIFPMVYLVDPVELAVDGLREWPGLPGNLRTEMEVIWEDYDAQREIILDRLIDALQRWEAPENAEVRREFDQKIGEIMRARQEGRPIESIEPEETPPFTFEPLQQRHELALATLSRLSALFQGSERAGLPAHVRLCLDLPAPQ